MKQWPWLPCGCRLDATEICVEHAPMIQSTHGAYADRKAANIPGETPGTGSRERDPLADYVERA